MGLFGLNKPTKRHDELKLLTTVYDNEQLAIVRCILDGDNIPYLTKERGSGSSVKIIMGFSMFGTDIFVKSEQLEQAQALLEATYGSSPDDDREQD